jgi:hypothetical protein
VKCLCIIQSCVCVRSEISVDYLVVNDVSVQYEITRLRNRLSAEDGVVCFHYQGRVYCCAVHCTLCKETVGCTVQANASTVNRFPFLVQHIRIFRHNLEAVLTFDPAPTVIRLSNRYVPVKYSSLSVCREL